ncbi:Type I phosphodiesterase / nucleotide pyrophosphatase [Pedococcus dokdonensis]|uniref:Type I phosphodiesterase / nucleotide pyrophosphatase n=1 Tax=Pedococcus dokdonensis TaxID=443156 RepID=A0A1H0L0Z6_9MICO|nr:alkaline phosphatase family protein [Pedococcus dokdonensis]SDO61713.1 Type I phosphodiesterase / nucleotide pyrophosphatase [Pedococcus dokdonensis]
MSREAVVKSLTTPDLAAVVDLVVWVEDDVAHAANHLGTVRLHDDGTHEVLSGIDPVADEDPMAFLPYDAEVAGAGPRVSTDNAYPYAARRIRSLFGDPDRSPDVAVVHTPRHWFVDEGGHVGEHGSLDVIQSRAPLVLSGPGVRRLGVVDEHARLVDVAPTLAVLSGVPEEDLRDADGAALDGRALTAYLEAPEARRRPRVVGILWDGAHCGDLLHLAETGHLPGVARLLERGLALRGGAVAEFPSVTLTNHTSILTGVGPGRHGVLGNVYYDRALQERVVPNDAETWHRSAEWLRPGARTVFEMVNDHVPQGDSPRTASVDEAIDRGADYGTMALLRAAGGFESATSGMGDLLPDPAESPFLRDPAHLDDAYFRWGVQVDDLGLQQVLQLWETPEEAPTLTWWANVVTDAGHHGGGPRSELARDSLRQSDARLVAFLDHLDGLGVLDEVTFLLTADHGFEGADPSVTGSWKPALDALGIPYRDEGPGFVYLL